MNQEGGDEVEVDVAEGVVLHHHGGDGGDADMGEEVVESTIYVEDEMDEQCFEQFNVLCADLNLDAHTRDNTWATFASVKGKYTLEVRRPHFLGHSYLLFLAIYNVFVSLLNRETLGTGCAALCTWLVARPRSLRCHLLRQRCMALTSTSQGC